MRRSSRTTRHIFLSITARPWYVVGIALVVVLTSLVGLTHLTKDTSVKAFIPDDHESLRADRMATELFGISESIALAVVTTDGGSVFTPSILALVDELSVQIAGLPNVRYDRVASVATESSIRGESGNVFVEPYVQPFAMDKAFADESRARWEAMFVHRDTLVSEDGRGAVIMAELIDPSASADTYQAALEIAARVTLEGVEVHVAGPGAVSGFLSRYIDRDARKLQPLVFVLVLALVYLAFRRAVALPGPLLVVIGSTAGSLGVMGWCGIPYYAITNALPVIVVAISVADVIHILSAYFQLRERNAGATVRETVVRAMDQVARPITITTVTTIAGFLGIAAMSIMPPITYFAIFSSLGVALAWAFSIAVLPNVLLLVPPGSSPAFAAWQTRETAGIGHWLGRLSAASALHWRGVLAAFLIVTVVAIWGALQLRIDRSQVENFAHDEPIRVADELINNNFGGTAFLDVIVEADSPGGVLRLDNMRKLRALQEYFESLPHVNKTVSIVDYLSQLHGALDELPEAEILARELPNSDATLAETLFVYEITGDPGDLAEEIDADYQHALIRGALDAHYFSENRGTVEALKSYIDEQFTEPGLSASLAGDVNIGYHWMRSLQDSHFKSVALSLALVLIVAVVMFGSPAAGLVSVIPVLFTVLALYACMGYLGIYLEPATSMFAAIALGVGVDFAIHLVDSLRAATEELGSLEKAIDKALPTVARACFFNSAALGMGFSVLLVSELPTLMRFGGLVALAAFCSYLAALFLVPSLLAARRCWSAQWVRAQVVSFAPMTLLLLGTFLVGLFSPIALADPVQAERIGQAVANREEASTTRRIVDMTTTDRRGRTEIRSAILHKQSGDSFKSTRISFVAPKKYLNMTFLTYDYRTGKAADDRWMYLPASRRVRSIPASRRGNSFFGTDFSYEDMQSELKFSLSDWRFEYGGQIVDQGRVRHKLVGSPSSQRIARELGYGGFTAIIDEAMWMPVVIDFVDPRQRALKKIEVQSVELIDEIWTPTKILATNHQTKHKTQLQFRDTEHRATLDQRLFDAKTLARGLRAFDEG